MEHGVTMEVAAAPDERQARLPNSWQGHPLQTQLSDPQKPAAWRDPVRRRGFCR
jgi:hypothetical protein